jgi:hypothetical protein
MNKFSSCTKNALYQANFLISFSLFSLPLSHAYMPLAL